MNLVLFQTLRVQLAPAVRLVLINGRDLREEEKNKIERKMPSLKLVQSVLVVSGIALMLLQEVQMESVPGEDDGDTNNDKIGRVIYDQRQSGKYNIHLVIKDVAIIEMGQNEIEDVGNKSRNLYLENMSKFYSRVKIRSTCDNIYDFVQSFVNPKRDYVNP